MLGILIQKFLITTPELIFNISSFLPIFYLANPMCVHRVLMIFESLTL